MLTMKSAVNVVYASIAWAARVTTARLAVCAKIAWNMSATVEGAVPSVR